MTAEERLKNRVNDILKFVGAVHKIGNSLPEPIDFEAEEISEQERINEGVELQEDR